MKGVPAIPMIQILTQWAIANGVPLDAKRWESILRCFNLYNEVAQLKN